ncbi:TPA: TIGR03751 family conjugal transfer lipoprotein [Legionella pneumophila]|nr:TIGR03751 family conjugal transfer lipoprotein [Legionella pneumophila]
MAKMMPLVLIMTLSSLLGACASSVRTGRVPEEGLTVSQIYHQVIDENEVQDLRRIKEGMKQKGIKTQQTHYEGAFHQAFMNGSHGFKQLDNPAIPIYITPKVVLMGDEQFIKPGFVTQFFLFKKNQFALMSEKY